MKYGIQFLAMVFLLAPVTSTHAQSGKVLVEEHFKENDRGWNLGEDNNVVRKIENGRLVMEAKKYLTGKGGGYWIKMPDYKLPSNNFSLSYTTRWIKNMKTDNSYSPYGVILGDYYFLLYADGDRRLLKYNSAEKKYETLVDWNEQAIINKKGTADNKWEITYQNGQATFYANGQMMYKKDVTLPADCPVKLYIENSEVVEFDDIVVKSQ